MRVLITGGTGFLGSRLARRHIEAGDEVRVIAKEATELEASNGRDLRALGADVRVGDVCDESHVREAVQGVQRVYHIAAAMREANVPDDHFWEVNVRATERLLGFSREAGVERVVYCSTAGVVGTDRAVQTAEESAPKQKGI